MYNELFVCPWHKRVRLTGQVQLKTNVSANKKDGKFVTDVLDASKTSV
jgi:hypothetical protein